MQGAGQHETAIGVTAALHGERLRTSCDDTATTTGSIVVGGFHHGTANAVREPTATTQWDVTDVPDSAPNGHFHAIGRATTVTASPQTVTIGSATTGPYSLTSAIEIVPLR